MVGFLAVFNGRLGMWYPDKAVLIGVGLLFIIMTVKLIPDVFKQGSPKLVTNPFHDTTTGDRMTAGDYSLFRGGGIRHRPVPVIEGRDFTVATLSSSVNPIGDNRVITTKCEMVSLQELPSEVISVILEHNLPAPYYLGLADEESYDIEFVDEKNCKHTIGSTVAIIKQENKLNRLFNNALDNNPEDILKAMKMSTRLGKEAVDTSTTEKLKRTFLSD